MKKSKSVLITMVFILMAALVASTGFAGDLDPSGAPAPTMKTLDEVEPRIPISAVPFTASSPGSYYLTGDLTSTSTGIIVTSPNTTIDLMGFTLTGSAVGSGVYMQSAASNNVEIKNGSLAGFNKGVSGGSSSAKNYRVINIRTYDNVDRGVYLSGTNHLIENSMIQDNGSIGIHLSENSIVRNSVISGNSDSGIYGRSGSIIENNMVSNNGNHGIQIEPGSLGGTTLIRGNNVTQNTGYGIQSTISSVIENIVSHNGSIGIFATGSIINNTSYKNSNAGFSSSNSILIGNYAHSNTGGSCSCTGSVINTDNYFQ